MNELWVSPGALLWSEVRPGPERSSLYISDMTHLKKKKKKERPAPLGLRGQETGPGKHVGLAFQSAQHLWETIGPPFLVLENYLGLSMTFYFQNWATDLDLARFLFLSPSPTSDPRHTLL